MSDSLFSQSWYRVAKLKPGLRSHAEIHRHSYRDNIWYVLQDHSSGRFNRYSPEAYLIIQLMDTKRTMEDIWQLACEKLGDDMPSQDEIISLLGQLHKIDLLQTDKVPDIADIHDRFVKQRRNKVLQYIKSPLSIRIPLLDPDEFLNKTLKFVRPIFSTTGLILWFLILAYALTLAGIHWNELTQNWSDRLFDSGNFFLLWLAYPLVKLFHELAHGYAVKRFGGEVHEMGLMFLVFVPIPYVDASSASAFRSKKKRMLVGAIGIMMEMAIASIGIILWVNMEPGLARALIYNVILIGGVSTLLFNGNPLLRFDAYYVLSDMVEIPNLGAKANSYVGYWIQKHILRIEDMYSTAGTRREAMWLWSYSIASFIYRLFIMVAIALFVASKFFIVGILIAFWSLYNMLILPGFKLINKIKASAILQRYHVRLVSFVSGTAVFLLLFLFVIPFPLMSVTEGVLWAPEESQFHVQTNCFISKVLVKQKQPVKKSQLLVRCESPELEMEVKSSRARLSELKARQRASLTEDRSQYEIISDELARVKQELAIALEKLEGLNIHAPLEGIVNLTNPQDLVGQFAARGRYIGYIQEEKTSVTRVVVSQDDINPVMNDLQGIDVKLAEFTEETLPAVIKRGTPAATTQLPSRALSVEGGGSIILDPESRDGGIPVAYDNYFIFDIDLQQMRSKYIGQRVYVRFHHTAEPVGFRLFRATRRLFLDQFDV